MKKTLKEWKEYVSKRGTSGDMVYDILSDWEEQNKKLVEGLRNIFVRGLNVSEKLTDNIINEIIEYE